jgi:2-C-methyl-D-erythritol 4-phosphate cytidylyltransferase/2-C-methyl-D-erythritol 2,4-cyclodiphosphate synthase
VAVEVRGAAADAVVVAAGSSRRMAGIDKTMASVGGRPLLAWALDALTGTDAVERIVIVAGSAQLERIAKARWRPVKVVAVVAGGPSRQASVAAGVRHLVQIDPGGGDRPLLVHDGARPAVTGALVEAVVDAVRRHGAAIPVMPLAETLKRIDGELVRGTLDRGGLATAQTPQGMRRQLLLDAWASFPVDEPPVFTDEAALLEACRIPVHAIPGEPANIKVTLPDDLARVAHSLDVPLPRVGFGHDSHPFGPGRPLRLGGIEIEDAPRLVGHSDGDVVLHAVADALLGAAGLGDLGRQYPSDGRTPIDVASLTLLDGVVERIRAAGWAASSVDVVVIAARPRLAGRLDDMRTAIASALRVDTDDVNVKASSGNLAGDEGAGRSISARAVATVRSLG